MNSCFGRLVKLIIILLRNKKSISSNRNFHALPMMKNLRKQPPRGVLRKSVVKICSKFTREHLCRSVISIKLLCNFIQIILRHGRSPANLLQIFRTLFLKNTSGRLLLVFLVSTTIYADQCTDRWY